MSGEPDWLPEARALRERGETLAEIARQLDVTTGRLDHWLNRPARLQRERGEWVYFLQAEEGGPIKIGRGNVEKRLKEAQTGSPHRLVITRRVRCKSRADACSLEARLHRHFDRFRLEGEWFLPVDELAAVAQAKRQAESEMPKPLILRRAYSSGYRDGANGKPARVALAA